MLALRRLMNAAQEYDRQKVTTHPHTHILFFNGGSSLFVDGKCFFHLQVFFMFSLSLLLL